MITNIREARACLDSYGLLPAKAGAPHNARRKQISQRARWLLTEMAESGVELPVFRVRETLSADIFDAITLDASHNSLMDGYGEVPADWKRIATVKSTPDFKTVNASRMGGLGNLSTVAENAEYANLSQLDERVTYTPAKRGNLLSISMEAMFGDAIGAFNEQAQRLGRSAANTLNEFVLGTLFDDNPTCDYDSVALFNTAHGNTAVAALTHATLQTAIAAILNQTGAGGEQIYIRPTFLAVNPALAISAKEFIMPRPQIAAGSSNVLQSDHNAVSDWLMTDLFISPHLNAAPADAYVLSTQPIIEVSFVRGEQSPAILREPEGTGKSFLTDAITWKVRHAYGGDVIDHRGAYKIDAA